MNFNNYTTKAAEAVQGTIQLASQLSHQALSPLHLLLVLLKQKDGIVPTLLQQLEKNLDEISEKVQEKAFF